MCCHGRVPGCSSCPCSAPAVSANGAKVSGAVVALPATSPWRLCVPALGSRNTSLHVENACCVLFLLFSISPALKTLPCYPAAVLLPVSTNQAKPPFSHGISLSHGLPQLPLLSPSLMP